MKTSHRLPLVAVVGRPNVGKSSLFNKLIGQRLSIEEDVAGVTRDRIMHKANISGRQVMVVDTGGLGIVDRHNLESDVEEQIALAMAGADFFLFVVDASHEITDLDREVAKRLRKINYPFLLVANKADNDLLEQQASEWAALGMGEPLPISVLHQRGLDALNKTIAKKLPFEAERLEERPGEIRLALVGRRNVGKSSLLNEICGDKRVIVSDVPGTTRDCVDVQLTREGLPLTVIDTAGLRKKNQTEDSVEFFSMSRTYGAILRSDITFFMIDATRGISQVDQKLSRLILDYHKPTVLVVNKWDLAEGVSWEDYQLYLRKRLTHLSHAPMCAISVKNKANLNRPFLLLNEVQRQLQSAPTTSLLNKVLEEAQERKKPKRLKGLAPKFFYMTQLGEGKARFIIFGKHTKSVQDGYMRYLKNFFRKRLDMAYLPLQFVLREK